MKYITEITSYLAQFSFKVALNFFGKASKNSFFSPYSLFAALLLTSALDTNTSPGISKYLNYSNTEISSDDQVSQLKFLTKSIQTVPSLPKPLNSSSFIHFISKYDFTNDQKYISYKLLKKMIKNTDIDPSLDKEQIISTFLSKMESDRDDTNLSKIAHQYKMIIENEVKQYPIIIPANYLFINNGTSFPVPDSISHHYNKFISKTDFPKPGYIQINKLVENSTRGLISNFLSSSDLPPSLLYFVVNTIYFKGLWEKPFTLLNWKKEFKSISGAQKKIDFLKAKNQFEFYENDDFIYVNLNYNFCQFSFEIIMPKETKNFEAVRSKLYGNEHLLDKIVNITTFSKAFVMIPKFTLKTDLMNFGNILNIPGVDSIVQKAVIIVDEKGTEAAAASGISTRSLELDQPKELIIDQPFMFLIRDRQNNIPLFIGEFVDPPDE